MLGHAGPKRERYQQVHLAPRYSCCVGAACGNVRHMRSETMQQRSVVVVVAREGRVG